MKKFLLFVIALLTTFAAWAGEIFADGDLVYEVFNEGINCEVQGLSQQGKATDNLYLTIPGRVFHNGTYLDVIRVQPSAFKGQNNLVSVRFSYRVIQIFQNAFQDCKNLEIVNLPSSMLAVDYGAFAGCTALKTVRCAAAEPPAASYTSFPVNSGMTLHVSKAWSSAGDIVGKYSNATGWNMFSEIKKTSEAYDIYCSDGALLVVTSPPYEPGSGDPRTGEMALVGFNKNGSAIVDGALVPACGSSTYNFDGYSYWLTTVAEYACYYQQDLKSIDFSELTHLRKIEKGAFEFAFTIEKAKLNCDTIDQDAFYGVNILHSLTFGPRLKFIGDQAFDGCHIYNDVILPYGIQYIGEKAFFDGTFKRILIPSSLIGANYFFLSGVKSLQEIIFNDGFWSTFTNWDLTGIPTSCKLLVPTGKVQQYRNNPKWGTLNVQAGAYDFNYGASFDETSRYHMTVTGITPVTHEGVTYDGTAKYVFHPNIQASDIKGFTPSIAESDDMLGSSKKYLITEIGDSCFTHTITNFTQDEMDLTPLTALEKIGHDAFWQSNFKELKLPASVTEIGEFAFCNMPRLTDFYVENPNPVNIESSVFSDADQQRATLHVPTQAAVAAYKAARIWRNFYKIVCDATSGDIDGNGVVNVSDVTALINKILGTASFDDAICDIDGNGVVNVSDVTALINIILQGS